MDHPPIILKEIFQLTEDPDYKPIGDNLWKQILLLQVLPFSTQCPLKSHTNLNKVYDLLVEPGVKRFSSVSIANLEANV